MKDTQATKRRVQKLVVDARKKATFSQSEVARRLNMELREYQEFERCERQVGEYKIQNLAELLGVTFEYLTQYGNPWQAGVDIAVIDRLHYKLGLVSSGNYAKSDLEDAIHLAGKLARMRPR